MRLTGRKLKRLVREEVKNYISEVGVTKSKTAIFSFPENEKEKVSKIMDSLDDVPDYLKPKEDRHDKYEYGHYVQMDGNYISDAAEALKNALENFDVTFDYDYTVHW